MTHYWGGTGHFFLRNLWNFKNIGGGLPPLLRGPCYNGASPTSRCNRAEQRYEDSRDLCFSKDVAFMTERGGSVSHLKHETFSSLQYATDFGTIFIRNP